jgi:hypothetical protein
VKAFSIFGSVSEKASKYIFGGKYIIMINRGDINFAILFTWNHKIFSRRTD